MSNSNDNKEISSNVATPGRSNSVGSSTNNCTTNEENVASNKITTNNFIGELCDSKGNYITNQDNNDNNKQERRLSPNQNAEASCSNPFDAGTTEVVENVTNFRSSISDITNNKGIKITQPTNLIKNEGNVINERITNISPPNTIQHPKRETGLLPEISLTTDLKTINKTVEAQNSPANKTELVVPQQLQEIYNATTASEIAPRQTHEDLQISPTETNTNSLGNQAITINSVANEPINVFRVLPESMLRNMSLSEFQVTTSIYLTSNTAGLPYQPSLTENQRATVALPQTDSSETVTTNSSTSTTNAPNLEIVEHVPSVAAADRADTDLSIQPESDVEVNITPPPVQPCVIQGPPPIAGAPPTYSAIMRLGPDDPCRVWTQSIRIQPSAPFIAPAPPPPYTETPDIQTERAMLVATVFPTFSAEQMIWGPDPISVVCPRCNNVVVTTTHSQRSNLTHFSAIALCLCGCWPCCLLPYCMDSCKNIYHYCSACQQFLGVYRPW